MSGILGTGQGEYQSAISGLSKTNDIETQRQTFNKQSEQAYTQQKTSGAVGGAMTGAMIGTEIMPGWGTAAGAVIGGIAGWLA